MPHFLLSVYRPTGHVFADDGGAMRRDIDRLNEEMVAAGVRVFVGGLRPPQSAICIQGNGPAQGTATHGPALPGALFLDGLWVLDVPDLAAAEAWGRHAAQACRATIEVRPFW